MSLGNSAFSQLAVSDPGIFGADGKRDLLGLVSGPYHRPWGRRAAPLKFDRLFAKYAFSPGKSCQRSRGHLELTLQNNSNQLLPRPSAGPAGVRRVEAENFGDDFASPANLISSR